MNIRHAVLTAALALAFVSPVQAEGLKPIQGQDIDLGAVSGAAYYTVEQGSFRVIATLAQDEDAAPVRFEATLAPGQSVVLSTPRGVGIPPDAVEISRENDTMLVRKAAAAVTN